MSPDVCVLTCARTPQDNNKKVDLQEPPHECLVTSAGDVSNDFVVQARRSILLPGSVRLLFKTLVASLQICEDAALVQIAPRKEQGGRWTRAETQRCVIVIRIAGICSGHRTKSQANMSDFSHCI